MSLATAPRLSCRGRLAGRLAARSGAWSLSTWGPQAVVLAFPF